MNASASPNTSCPASTVVGSGRRRWRTAVVAFCGAFCGAFGFSAAVGAALVATQGAGSTGGTNDHAGEAEVTAVDFPPAILRRIQRHGAMPALPPDPTNRFADDPSAANFGHRLFFETRFSPAEISCATCHDPQRAFTDGKSLGEGIGTLTRNTPSVLNAAHQRWLHWDGSADSLWAQATRPLEHPDEMGGDRLSIHRLIAFDEELRREYEAVFGPVARLSGDRLPERARPSLASPSGLHLGGAGGGGAGGGAPGAGDDAALIAAWSAMSQADRDAVDGVFVNVAKALAAHQRRLVTGPTPFDRFVVELHAGRDGASVLPVSAQRGALLFFGAANCWQCHSGPMFSDGEFHSIGMPPRAGGMPRDPGRFLGLDTVVADPFNAAGPHSDDRDGESAQLVQSLRRSSSTWGEFRTPSLRHVARTAPYMHQGQRATLRDVVEFYSTLDEMLRIGHQHETILVPLNLTATEIDDLVAFLESLTADPLPEALLAPPRK